MRSSSHRTSSRPVPACIFVCCLIALLAFNMQAWADAIRDPPRPVQLFLNGPQIPDGRGPGRIANPRARVQGEIAVRTESTLGRPARLYEDPSEGPWLVTLANQFINIKKTGFFRANSKTVNGVQVSASFVTAKPSNVAIHFTAEACVGETPPIADTVPQIDRCAQIDDTNHRMFVRALVDGKPAEPNDVVFAVGNTEGVRSFIFTTQVEPGIHTVEMQWLVDPSRESNRFVMGFMRNAALLIRQDAIGGPDGPWLTNLAVRTAPSGPAVVKDTATWETIPQMVELVNVDANGVVTASFSSETFTAGDARMAVRALLDGVPMQPSDMIYAKGSQPQSRSVTFVQPKVQPGNHQVEFQWFADGQGSIGVGDRSISVSGMANAPGRPNHPVAAMSGIQDKTASASFALMPGMTLEFWVPEKGNGEAAIMFSGEVGTDTGATLYLALSVDGQFISDTITGLTTDDDPTAVRSWIFDVKKLSPGLHVAELLWAVGPAFQGKQAIAGDRTLALISEVADIPDLAEQTGLGVGRDIRYDNNNNPVDPDHVDIGLAPVIGGRDVLVILWDADRPGQPDQFSLNYEVASLDDAIFNDPDSVKAYFEIASGGRFTINKAAVLGWFDALLPEATNYWNHPNDGNPNNGVECAGAYSDGATQRASEAVMLAGQSGFPFAGYDVDNNGSVDASELAIVVIYPQSPGFSGRARQRVYAAQSGCGGAMSNQPLVADGIVVEDVIDCFGCDAVNWMATAHELGHQMLGLDDLYSDAPNPATHIKQKALMAIREAGNTAMLNPAYRLALGWVTPETIAQPGIYQLLDTKLSDMVYVLPRYNSKTADEYFILENRQQDTPVGWDKRLGGSGDDSGIGVWHIVNEAVDRFVPPMGVDPDLWTALPGDPLVEPTPGRQGIRLLRPWTAIRADDLNAVFVVEDAFWSLLDYDLKSAVCPILFGQPGTLIQVKNTLTWADCSASGYGVKFLSPPPIAPNAGNPESTKMFIRVTTP